MSFSVRTRNVLRVAVVLAFTAGTGSAQAQQSKKSNVARERCAHSAARAVNTPGSVYYAAPVRGGHISGGGIAGAIIGAVVVTAIASAVADSARKRAENNCLVAAGLRLNTPDASGDRPKRSGSGAGSGARASRDDGRLTSSSVGAGSAWMRRAIRSQQ
jgi:hypothetical protein